MRRRIRVDLRFAVAGALSLVAAITVMTLTTPPERVAVLVAGDDLSPGVALGDLPLIEARLEPLPGLIPATRRAEIEDRTLQVPLSAGTPLLDSLLVGGTPTSDVLAVTLELGNAVQGDLVSGDLVDVYVSDDLGTRRLADGVTVIAAVIGSGGLAGNDVAVLLAVDQDLAPLIITGMRTGSIDLVRRGR